MSDFYGYYKNFAIKMLSVPAILSPKALNPKTKHDLNFLSPKTNLRSLILKINEVQLIMYLYFFRFNYLMSSDIFISRS